MPPMCGEIHRQARHSRRGGQQRPCLLNRHCKVYSPVLWEYRPPNRVVAIHHKGRTMETGKFRLRASLFAIAVAAGGGAALLAPGAEGAITKITADCTKSQSPTLCSWQTGTLA